VLADAEVGVEELIGKDGLSHQFDGGGSEDAPLRTN